MYFKHTYKQYGDSKSAIHPHDAAIQVHNFGQQGLKDSTSPAVTDHVELVYCTMHTDNRHTRTYVST